ncbi:MAG TPA: CRISPR-associated endonuclease Cas2 [Candidatus Paceibacterota bacterium]
MDDRKRKKRLRIGGVSQKILLLLGGGLSLGLTHRPDIFFRVAKDIGREWSEINHKSLRDAIRNLYASKMVDYKEEKGGKISIVLTGDGKKRALRYSVKNIKIKKPKKWDGMWRIVIFDIPEDNKQGRDALAKKLKELGFKPIQKSVFVYPYECRDEIDFITEVFNLRPYVRLLLVKDIDIEPELLHHFKL